MKLHILHFIILRNARESAALPVDHNCSLKSNTNIWTSISEILKLFAYLNPLNHASATEWYLLWAVA